MLVAGCSSDDDSGAEPSDTGAEASASGTSTPEPTHGSSGEPTAEPSDEQSSDPGDDSTPDADPTAELEAEITEFFEEYIETVNQSWTSEDALARRREMFSDSCNACLAGYELADEALSNGWRLEGEPSTVGDVSVTSYDGDIVAFLAVSDAPAAELIDPGGSVVDSFDENLGKQIVYQVQRNEDGAWVIIKSESL
ncbi:hypothetical protein [Phytoactinopolyspora endophytica]|uniref:hypothetical protein n=1 Tax=Phytoactinopolyspora endophytica TaxID=1642495 RepID=UPI00101C5CF4|nr:hypothetical protein [Phytoactinopolyspora endophytica]